MLATAKDFTWQNRTLIATLVGGAIAITIGFGIKLARSTPSKINVKDIAKDGGKYITTSDGRIVEYFVYGSKKPDASIIINIAGGLGTGKYVATSIKGLSEYCITNNIRGIAITLPGWGYSSLNPRRKYINWPVTDLEPILKAENVDTFAISGVSLGTPHAMAAAYHYKNRVTTLGLRVPFLGLPLSKEEGLPIGQASLSTNIVCGGKDAWWYTWPYHLGFWCLHQVLSSPTLMRSLFNSKVKKEYPEYVEPAIKDLLRGGKHSGHYGLMQCMAYDTILEWGFDVRQIVGVEKVVVWYAADDDDCPPSHGKWIGEYFGNRDDVKVNVRVFDGYGHIGGMLQHLKYIKTVMSSTSW